VTIVKLGSKGSRQAASAARSGVSPSPSFPASASASSPSSSSSREPPTIPAEEQRKRCLDFVAECRKRKLKMIVFDMDRTLIAMHTSGALLEPKLASFKTSLSSVAKTLIPILLEEKFQISVSTLSDDIYSDILVDKDKKQNKPVPRYYAGVELVKILLETFLTEDQINQSLW